MKRKIILTLTALFISFDGFSQQELGIKLNLGLSRISIERPTTNVTSNSEFTLSGQAGGFYNLHLSKKSSLGAELLFIQIEGKETINFDLTDSNGSIIGETSATGNYHISYLGLPVYYGFTFNKFTITLGAQASVALASGYKEKGEATINGDFTDWEN
ncbi:MAG: outer membrane beta-barrel protein, partial [Chitinophagales bacterium]